MIITYGTRFYGKVATVNNQWVETKFFNILFIPIYPISSIFVTSSQFNKRQGFTIETNSKSVTAAYARVFLLILAALMFLIAHGIWNSGFSGENTGEIMAFRLIGVSFIAAWTYFCFFYGKATPEDTLLRNKVGTVTGIYAMPQWFDYPQLRNMLKGFLQDYQRRYPDSDWKTELNAPVVPTDKGALLYIIALFTCVLDDAPENYELYVKADSIFMQ